MLKIRDKAGEVIGVLKDDDNTPEMTQEYLDKIKKEKEKHNANNAVDADIQ